jgi:hypothetical protein
LAKVVKKMTIIEKAWQSFVEQYTKGDVEAAQAFYLAEVWPRLVEAWRRAPRGEVPSAPYPASVHTLGTSPEAAVLAALALGAKEVHLLHTADTARHLPFVAEWTGAKVVPHEIDREDPTPLYRVVRAIVAAAGGPVALDMTGGTKVMSAALAAVGFVLRSEGHGVDVYYVSNDRYEPRVRRPVAGTERLRRVPPP